MLNGFENLKDKEKKTKKREGFSLTDAAGSPLKRQVMTKMPTEAAINDLWQINAKMGDAIVKCLKHVHSYIVLRNPQQNQPDFFSHVAATALYESAESLNLNGKDHGKKAGDVFNQVKKTLESINKALRQRQTPEHRAIYEKYQALFQVHYNAFVLALKNLPAETKAHHKTHKSIDVDNLNEIIVTPKKRARVENMHPATPSPLKGETPKRIYTPMAKSVAALKATQPPHPRLDPNVRSSRRKII